MNPSNPIVACQSKKAYQSKQEAEDTATYLFHEKGIDLDTYHCNICSNYHLTSGGKNERV